MISCHSRVKTAVSLLLVPVVIGVFAALAATAICSLTSATLSPVGGAVLGVAFGFAGGGGVADRPGPGRFARAAARGLLAGATTALVILLLQR
jgi:hypothetical protein